MRKLFSFFGMLMLCATLMAQTPSAFKYQAVARNQAGQVMADQPMSVRISILKGAQVEYSEIHSVTTNDLGLFTIEVGRGSPVSGTFFDITWNDNPHFVRIEMDPAGGSNFMFLGISELLSVPYAQHAETVTNNDDADADPDNEIQDLKVVGNFLRITNNPSPTQIDLTQFNTDEQQISYDADNFTLTLENGGTVSLHTLKDDADANPTNELQTVTQVGSIVSLSQGGGTFSIDDADANPINELQTLTQNGNTISLSQGGGSVTITENDGDPENELQDLIFNNNYLYISNQPHPTIINLNHLLDNTDAQQIAYDSVTGNLSLDNGGVVNLSSLEDDADADVTNELQTISRAGNDLVLSHNGGTVNIEDGDSDNTNEIQTVSQNGLDVTLSHGGGTFSVADDDNSIVNEIQDLQTIGDSLYITNNPSATAINLGAHDNQTLNFSASTYELTIANGNTVDLTDLKDDDDSNPLNEIQDLYLQNDSLVISNNPWATVIDMSPYMDNTDAQTLTFSNDSIKISNGNGVDLSSYLDNTDGQTLSVAGTDLTISTGNTVSLAAFMDDTDEQTLSIAGSDLSISGGNTITIPSSADNLGNHTATQNVKIGAHYISNDGDAEGIRITTTGNVTASGNMFIGETATTNSDLTISGRVYDWDDNAYYMDPNFRSHLTDLRVTAGVIVNTGGITVTAGGMNVTGDATFVNNATVGGTFGVTGATTLSSTLAVSGTSTLTGDVTMDGRLDVAGKTFLVGNVSMSNMLEVSGATTLSSTLAVTGDVTAPVYVSTVSTGTAPMTVSSTTLVNNLNADLLDGLSSADFLSASTNAGGDLSGTMSNLQISAGVVGTTEIADANVTSAKLASDLALTGWTSVQTLQVQGSGYFDGSIYMMGINPIIESMMGMMRIDFGWSGNSRLYNLDLFGNLSIAGTSTLSSDLTVNNGDIDIDDSKAFYFGDKSTDGSWRIVRDGNDLVFERLESATWVQKTAMTP